MKEYKNVSPFHLKEYKNKFCKFGKTPNMSSLDLKKELHAMIDNMEDEEVLSMLKEECAFYSQSKQKDITYDLSPEQLKELENQLNEDPNKDTISLDQFKEATAKWRTK